MGGRAFGRIVTGATFPRMDPVTYESLKSQHLEQLRQLFHLVGVPREAPEKMSYGDIDYIVCSPLDKSQCWEDLKHALGAVHCIVNGHTVNLAIPLPGADDLTFYQVDVNHTKDEGEWERIITFHSYGDLGMILGLVARASGLSLGVNGLKISHPPQYNMTPFVLSTTFPRIFEFFGLDFAEWEAGFLSMQSAFQWVASSRLFDPCILMESHREHRCADREMYQKFLSWARDQKIDRQDTEETSSTMRSTENTVEEAKIFFGKKQEYDTLVEKQQKQRNFKDKFNGLLVMQWTGLYGQSVRVLMDEVRKTLDEDTVHGMALEEVKALVLEVQGKITI